MAPRFPPVWKELSAENRKQGDWGFEVEDIAALSGKSSRTWRVGLGSLLTSWMAARLKKSQTKVRESE